MDGLSKLDRQIILAALDKYRTIKSAEKMLTYNRQLKTDRDGAESTRTKYDALLTGIADLTKRLTDATS